MRRSLRLLPLCLAAALLAAPVPARGQETAGETDDPWRRSLALSALVTSGNTETTSAGANLVLERRPDPWGFTGKAGALREESGDEVTAERYSASFRLERDLHGPWSIYGSARGERDEPAGYELRTVTELGGLYDLLTGPVHELAFKAGASYTTEDPVAVDDSSEGFFGAVLGADYLWQIREGTRLTETLELFPNFDDSDDWRAASELALQADLAKMLAFQVGVQVRYDNRPFVDAEGNELDTTDTAVTLSLVFGDRE